MSLGFYLAPQRRVFAAFAIYAFCLGNIFPRLPDIQRSMGVEEGALGLALIGAPVGTLLALTFATPLLERIGFRQGLLFGIPLLAVLYAIAALAPGPLVFFALLIPAGLTLGSIEIMVNLEADRTEHLVGFRIMNRAHAFWSIGFFSAGLFGAAMGQLGISPQAAFRRRRPDRDRRCRPLPRWLPTLPTSDWGQHRRRASLRRSHVCDPCPCSRDAVRNADGGGEPGLVRDLYARRLPIRTFPFGLCGCDLCVQPSCDEIRRR